MCVPGYSFLCNCYKTCGWNSSMYLVFHVLSQDLWCNLILATVRTVIWRAFFVNLVGYLLMFLGSGEERMEKKNERKKERKKKAGKDLKQGKLSLFLFFYKTETFSRGMLGHLASVTAECQPPEVPSSRLYSVPMWGHTSGGWGWRGHAGNHPLVALYWWHGHPHH